MLCYRSARHVHFQVNFQLANAWEWNSCNILLTCSRVFCASARAESCTLSCTSSFRSHVLKTASVCYLSLCLFLKKVPKSCNFHTLRRHVYIRVLWTGEVLNILYASAMENPFRWFCAVSTDSPYVFLSHKRLFHVFVDGHVYYHTNVAWYHFVTFMIARKLQLRNTEIVDFPKRSVKNNTRPAPFPSLSQWIRELLSVFLLIFALSSAINDIP